MNIGETTAILPVPEAVAGAAAPAVGAGAAGFADRLAEAMGEAPAGAAAKPVADAAVADVAVGGVVVPVADVLAVQAALSGGAAVVDVKPGDVAEAGDAALAAVSGGVVAPDPGPGDPAVLAAAEQGVSDDEAVDEDAGEAVVPAGGDGADALLPVVSVMVPVPVVAPAEAAGAMAVAVPVPVADAVAGTVADGASPAVKPLRQAGRALAGAVSVTIETGPAPTVTGSQTGKDIPAEKAGTGDGSADGSGDEAFTAGEARPAKPKALASVTAAEPVVARAVEAVVGAAVAGVANAAAKPVVAEPKLAEPGAPVVQQAPLPVAQGADRTVAQPLRTDLPGWEQVLSERISAELSDDGQELELSLSPEKLGPLRIKLEMVDGLAQVKFITATPEAARVFTESQHRLTEGLSRAGIDLGSQSAESGRQGSQPDDRATQRNRMTEFLTHSRRIEAGDAPGLRRAAAGLVNLMA